MKKYLYIVLLTIVLSVAGLIGYQRYEIQKYKSLYDKELQNVEAYRVSNSGLEGEIREYRMTMDDLRSSKDSVDRKLAGVIDKLKIKDKRIEYLQYQTAQATKTDSVVMSDTIFVNDLKIDTLMGDKWYKLRLELNYPSTIVVAPTFNSEKYVVINTKKEYNNTPSKIFFIRWFQKKHWVTEVDVIERSPYINIKQQKYIKVVK